MLLSYTSHTSRISAMMALSLSFATLCGCGGGQLRDGIYQDREARYAIGALSEAWRPLSVEGQNDVAYVHHTLAAIIQANASCNPDHDIPLSSLTHHLLIGFTDRALKKDMVVSLDGREALQSHLVAKLDGVPRELLFVVLKKNGCVYDFALIASPGAPFEATQLDFEAFVQGFHADSADSADGMNAHIDAP